MLTDKNRILDEEDKAVLAGLPGPFLRWFGSLARDLPWRRDREPYHVWLSEIMLQQTRVEAVKGYYSRFLQTLPDIASLASAPEDAVLKLWEGLGYYRRAMDLRKAAGIIAREMNGAFPRTYEEILALPGIGAYTAGAIASICFGLPKPAIDGNVLRLTARLLDSDLSVDQPIFRKLIGEGLEEVMRSEAGRESHPGVQGEPPYRFDPGDFNQSLMEIGALICLPKGIPKCGQCPGRTLCRGCRGGRAEILPVRDVKKARRVEERTVFILWGKEGKDSREQEKRLALCRRGKEGLLAGMWEMPNVAGLLGPEEALAKAAAWGLKPLALVKSMERVHVFSHVEWRMLGYAIIVEPQGETAQEDDAREKRLVWTSAAERGKAYPLPAAFRLFLDGEG